LIAKAFSLDEKEVARKLGKSGDPYEVLARHIEAEAVEAAAPELPEGIFFEDERRRVYPNAHLGANLLGFTSIEGEEEGGRYGLERFYDDELRGAKGILKGAKDASGFLIALGRRVLYPPKNGSSLVLTVDYNIQRKAEEVLSSASGKWAARSGLVLVLEPESGKILAQAVQPGFDPNEFAKEKDFAVFLNPAAEHVYELGSVMKPITMAAALEEKAVRPESTYYDSGEVKIGGFTIRNFDGKAYHTQTMIQVLEKSLNTGAIHAARLVGKTKYLEYLGRFGFGEKSGIDLPGEVVGDISNLDAGREIDFATASFGQGIAVTPLQLARALAAVANGGKLMKPYMVEKIIDDSGNEVTREPELIREVISKETAETLTRMLVSAVRNGFENRAAIKGYFVAGKTGTAQIPRSDGRGYSDKVIHTFVGYAPAFDPRFLVLIQLNEPKGNRFAANTLT
jgi:cell division protein FtsI/penicillin-binding protein 2